VRQYPRSRRAEEEAVRKRSIAALIVVAAGALQLVGARPASAMMCERDLEGVCSVVGTVVCDVTAKGRPCLY
jgi:hypothetical protein